eukprot:m.79987 g.79987  ORF g.79987 m.79987 type:complete len:184 (-) comp12586_c0_seq3:238-789(-)
MLFVMYGAFVVWRQCHNFPGDKPFTQTQHSSPFPSFLKRCLSEIDVDTYGEAMLKAKSQVSHLTDANLIMMDSKVYEIGGLTSRVSVVETTDATSVLERATGLVTSMEQVTQEQKLGRLLFFVVDIVKQEAVLITADPQLADTVARAFDDATVQKDAATILVTLPGVLSRKKQILPTLEHVLG